MPPSLVSRIYSPPLKLKRQAKERLMWRPCLAGKYLSVHKSRYGNSSSRSRLLGNLVHYLRLIVGEEAMNIDALGPGIAEVYVGGVSAIRESVSIKPASSVANVEDCTLGAVEGVDYEATLDPGIQSVHHARSIAADNTIANDEACVEPLLGESIKRVTIP